MRFAFSAFTSALGVDPVVARVEMRLAEDGKVVDVIERGDLLTVVEEREEDYVIMTHDGAKGAVDKVNAVKIPEAVPIYSDLIARNPNEGRYYTLRASSYWALRKNDKAIEDFDRAIDLAMKNRTHSSAEAVLCVTGKARFGN